MTIALLQNQIQNYDWGSLTDIATLQGRPSGSSPEAELWMGAYPEFSSLVQQDGHQYSLADRLDHFVSKPTQERFGARLPFLMKYLAVARPLSIQVHPDDRAGLRGFNEGAFKDPHGKPELIAALTEMELLAGFRDERDVAKDLVHLGREELASDLEQISTGELFIRLLQDPDLSLLHDIKEAIHLTRDRAWLAEMLIKHPHEIAATAPLFMNHVHLHPYQALYVAPGTVHCYLSGFGVEVMSSSDNVIRAGLTSKPVDLPHFIELATLESEPQSVLAADDDGQWKTWRTPSPEFRLSHAAIDNSIQVEGLAIVAVARGEVIEPASGLKIQQGQSAIISDDSTVELFGQAQLFRCTINR